MWSICNDNYILHIKYRIISKVVVSWVKLTIHIVSWERRIVTPLQLGQKWLQTPHLDYTPPPNAETWKIRQYHDLFVSLCCNIQRWFFQLFNWFQLFFCEKEILKIAGHSQNRSKMTFLKGGVDGFSYFHWFSVILFSIQNHPWILEVSLSICSYSKDRLAYYLIMISFPLFQYLKSSLPSGVKIMTSCSNCTLGELVK